MRIAQRVGEEKFKLFLSKIGVLEGINFDIEEVGKPIKFNWGKCPLATASYGHGITTTPLQAAAAYATLANGGHTVKPTLDLKKNSNLIPQSIVSKDTSDQINKILRRSQYICFTLIYRRAPYGLT